MPSSQTRRKHIALPFPTIPAIAARFARPVCASVEALKRGGCHIRSPGFA